MKPLILMLLVAVVPVVAFASEDCLSCHADTQADRHLQRSAHAGKLGCADCHGNDHEAIVRGEQLVSAKVCGRCHQQEYAEHEGSRHGMGLHAGWGCTRNEPDRNRQECQFCHQEGDTRPISTVQCARFIKQTSEMGQLGCNRCHMIESSCASCHTNHLTDARIVRDPQVCAKCHMGPDHPQWEAWKTSQHGSLYKVLGGEDAPDCQYCHMAEKTHDVSRGLTAPPSGMPYAQEKFTAQREAMLSVCNDCHGRGFSSRELQNADAVRSQTLALVEEARRIIRDLDDQGLLAPGPKDRPAHPQLGTQIVLDGAMLYEDISHIEALFFRMNKFAAAKTFKGAYHQNPDYTHWYGNAEVKLLLADIRGEALRLSEDRGPSARLDRSSEERALEVLKKQYERGELSDEEYRERKAKALEQILKQGSYEQGN